MDLEEVDSAQAQRVWQRVLGHSAQDDEQLLQQLIALEWEDASIYLHLSRRFSGSVSAALYRLFQQEHAHCACLRGIYTMMTGQSPVLPAVDISRMGLDEALKDCYGREMHRLKTYEERSEDPSYGHVFLRLRDQEREHCRVILQLLGRFGRR